MPLPQGSVWTRGGNHERVWRALLDRREDYSTRPPRLGLSRKGVAVKSIAIAGDHRLKRVAERLWSEVESYKSVLAHIQETCPHNQLAQIEVCRSGYSERICKHCGKTEAAYPKDGFKMTGVVEQLDYWNYVQFSAYRTDLSQAISEATRVSR